MANFIITYDLRQYRDYQRLTSAIQSKYPVHSKVLESVWYIKSNETAHQIIEYLRMYTDDGIAVFDMSNNDWETWNCDHQVMRNNWLK